MSPPNCAALRFPKMQETPAASLPLRGPMPATAALHADDAWRGCPATDVAVPLHVSTNFEYAPADAAESLHPAPPRPGKAYVYSRESQPVRDRVEAVLGQIDGGYAVTYSSGIAAVFAALVHYAPRRVAIRNGYHGTHATLELFSKLSPVEILDIDDQLAAGDLLWIESPHNPTGVIYDIAAYAERARASGATFMVDSTFAPPPLQKCLTLGAHAVFHSCSKYMGGHSDLLGGALIFPTESEAEELREQRAALGSIMGNMESWLLLRGLRTLGLRVSQQSLNATELARWLHEAASCGTDFDGIPAGAVVQVMHASVQKTSFDKRKQMPGGYGAVFAVLMSNHIFARAVADRLKLFTHATSLGSVESLVEWRALSDPKVDKRLLRFSVGVEEVDDLKRDLRDTIAAAWKHLSCTSV